jgi:S1 RNA binding domain protein
MTPQVGDLAVGKVVELRPNGAVVDLADGTRGFLHASEIPAEEQNRMGANLAEGQEVLVKVIGCDRLGRPSLSLTRVTPRDRETAEFHREVQAMRSALAGHPVATSGEPHEEGVESHLGCWLGEAEGFIARLRRNRTERLSKRFYTD